MATYDGRYRGPLTIPLTKTLAAIKETRKARAKKDKLEAWLECYREDFQHEHGLALNPPSSDSEDEPYQSRSLQYLKGAGVVLKLSPEVFYEIFSYLGLEDLLSLSRTCKRFRGILMSISTRKLWQRAIRRLKGLPPCPRGLSEPQYASLIYSETCSECGEPVFGKMDVRLHVKLCAKCQSELLEAYQAGQQVDNYVPTTNEIYIPSQRSIVFALKRDVDTLLREAAVFKATNPGASLDKWGSARTMLIRKQEESNAELGDFISEMLEAREEDVEAARRERRHQIVQRLLQGVWTSRDMRFSDELLESWDQLVNRKKPIDDQAWAKLRPKLEALLMAKREQDERQVRDGRLRERHKLLVSRLSSLNYSSPVLVEATIKGSQRDYAQSMYRCDYWDREDISKVKTLFPTPASAMNLPIIRNLVEKDISGSDMGQDFDTLSSLINQHIAAWRTQVERDLVNIWREGNKSPPLRDQDPPTAADQLTQHPSRSKAPAGAKVQTKLANRAPLPKVQLKFTRADGKTTPNIQDLPDDLRLLLRADIIFRTQGGGLPVRRCSYPEIVSGSSPYRYNYSGRSGQALGNPWDPTTIARDDDASRIARLFLEGLQLPEATSAEMRVFGAIFKCRKCKYLTPNTWESLVSHYATEISRFREAQERIRELGSTVVYNDTHNTKGPCFKIIPPNPREYQSTTLGYGRDVACKMCEALGIKALYRYAHGSTTTEMCPILEHLADAHGIVNPVINEHFGGPSQDDAEDDADDVEDDENEDDEDGCDTDNSYYGAVPTSDGLMDLAVEADLCDSDGEFDKDAAIAYFRKKMKRNRY